MKKLSKQEQPPYTILSRGIFFKTDEAPSFEEPKPQKWIYLAGKALALIGAITFIAFSFIWATDGSWNIAILFFMLGLFFSIPCIIFGREIKRLRTHELISESGN